jgi:hypothetical protein
VASEHQAMQRYLEFLLEQSEDGIIPIQLVFWPGAVQAAGGLRKGPVPETFELCYPTQAGKDGAALAGGADEVMVSDVFTAASVMRVVKMADMPRSAICVPGPGIVTPGRS